MKAEKARRRVLPLHIEAFPRKDLYTSLAFLLLVALALRLLGIASRPIWYDEAFAILFADKGIAAMLVGTLTPTGGGAADVHPLGYYSLLWAWMRLFGQSLVSVRLLSVVAGLTTVGMIVLLTHEMFDRRTALAAGVLMAINPFQVHYAQEIRMYSLLALSVTLAVFCYWRGSKSGSWAWWAAFSVCAAAAQYTHNLAAIHLAAMAAWPVLRREWRAVAKVAAATAGALVLYLPWLAHLPSQISRVAHGYWVDAPTLGRLLSLCLAFVANLPVLPGHLAVALFVSLSLIALSCAQTARAVRQGDKLAAQGLWMAYLAFVPPLLMFGVSLVRPVYIERALLPSGIAFLVWVAWAMMRPAAPSAVRYFAILAVGVGSALGLHQHLTYSGFPYAPFDELARSLSHQKARGDVVIHSSKLSMLPTVFFDRNLAQTYVADPMGSEVDTLAISTQRVLGLLASPNIEAAVGNARRVWFIVFEASNLEYVRSGQPRHPHLVWLFTRYNLVRVEHFDELDLYLFSRGT